MNPKQALQVLSIATEPGVKLSRGDYVNVQTALEVLNKLVEAGAPEVLPAPDAAKP